VIDLDGAVRDFMKDIGKTLRPLGFRGSRNRWTLVTEHGKVEIDRSTRNNWRDGEYFQGARGFMLTQHAIPEAWWRYENFVREHHGSPPLDLDDASVSGPRIMDFHGLPSKPVSPTHLWTIRPDPDHPGPAAHPDDIDFVREHLPWAVETLARRGMELIEPARYLKELLNQSDRQIGDWECIAVLLAEYGPSSALDEAISHLNDGEPDERTEMIERYAAAR
jgi:hypothetical protein